MDQLEPEEFELSPAVNAGDVGNAIAIDSNRRQVAAQVRRPCRLYVERIQPLEKARVAIDLKHARRDVRRENVKQEMRRERAHTCPYV